MIHGAWIILHKVLRQKLYHGQQRQVQEGQQEFLNLLANFDWKDYFQHLFILFSIL